MTKLENQSDFNESDECYIGVGIDKDGGLFTSIFIQKDKEKEFGFLLSALLSAKLDEEILKSLKQFMIDNPSVDSETILKDLKKFTEKSDDTPYIKPSQVRYFNEFFGA